MANSSGFVDFNQYAEQNAPEEQRLLEEAMQRAEAADQTARQRLNQASQEGERTGAASLSSTASYSDYLKASREATAAWAAVNSRSKDPRAAALQGSIGGDAKAKASASAAELAAREGVLGKRRGDAYAEGLQNKELQAAQQKKLDDEADARKRSSDEAKQAYIEAMTKGAVGRGAAGGTQRDTFGDYNEAASSGWARSQGGWEAQMLKNVGGTDEQQRGVWDAYTGKGSAGAGLGPKDRYQPMYREMQPWDPKEEG